MIVINTLFEIVLRTTVLKRDRIIWRCMMQDFDIFRIRGSGVLPIHVKVYCMIEVVVSIVEITTIVPFVVVFYVSRFTPGAGQPPISVRAYGFNALAQFLSEIVTDSSVMNVGPPKPYTTALERIVPWFPTKM